MQPQAAAAAERTREPREAPPPPSQQAPGLPVPCFGGGEVERRPRVWWRRWGWGAARVAPQGDDAGAESYCLYYRVLLLDGNGDVFCAAFLLEGLADALCKTILMQEMV